MKHRISKLVLADDVATKQVDHIITEVHKLQDMVPDHQDLSIVFSAPDTDTNVFHNLGRAPVGYFVIRKSAACDVYEGDAALGRANSKYLVLRGSAAATVTLRVF